MIVVVPSAFNASDIEVIFERPQFAVFRTPRSLRSLGLCKQTANTTEAVGKRIEGVGCYIAYCQ